MAQSDENSFKMTEINVLTQTFTCFSSFGVENIVFILLRLTHTYDDVDEKVY